MLLVRLADWVPASPVGTDVTSATFISFDEANEEAAEAAMVVPIWAAHDASPEATPLAAALPRLWAFARCGATKDTDSTNTNPGSRMNRANHPVVPFMIFIDRRCHYLTGLLIFRRY